VVVAVIEDDEMAKKLLTDLAVKKARIPRASRGAYIVWDMQSKGLALKVTPFGQRIFLCITSFPGAKGQCKRRLGVYPIMTLAEAREKVVDWRRLIAKNVDPKDEDRKRKIKEARARAHTFEAVLERYAAEHLSRLRRGRKDLQEIRREILPHWRHRLITDITRTDVVELIKPIAARAPTTAHLMLNHIKRIFSWAVHDGSYGLEVSPAILVKPKAVIGEKKARTRVLTNPELRAFWIGCDSLSEAYAGLFRLILLTGVRVSEASRAKWKEFDLDEKRWVIPAERFKSGHAHVVALSNDAVDLLKSLTRYKGCPFVFTVNGFNAVNGLSKAKQLLDQGMLAELRKQQLDAELADWVVHDLRRTYRTRLSELKVEERVAELAIGHGKRGLARTYDLHEFESEIRSANTRWAARLHSIVSGKTAKVVKLRA
jgi:integrase